jgi:hypothetical protein
MKENVMPTKHAILTTTLSILLSVTFVGCAMFGGSKTETKTPALPAQLAELSQTDLERMVIEVSDDVLMHPFPPIGTVPLVAPLGITNTTHCDLSMADCEHALTTELSRSDRMRFTDITRRDELQRERGAPVAEAVEAENILIGKQLGADYIVLGTLSEVVAVTTGQEGCMTTPHAHFQLTIIITDTQTGLIVLRKQTSRLRQASVSPPETPGAE